MPQVKQKIEAQSKKDRSRAKKAQEEIRWQALAMYEAGRDGAVKTRKQDEEVLAATRADFEAVQGAAGPVLERCARLAGPEPSAAAASPAPEPPAGAADPAAAPAEPSVVGDPARGREARR